MKIHAHLKRVSIFAAALFFAALPVIGQTVEGSISGTVVDQSGSVIASSEVGVVNQSTHLRRTAATSGIGTFTVPMLPPGVYTVSVSKEGFGRAIRKDVQVLVSQSATLDFTLVPAAVQQSVEITAVPPALDTTSGTVGQVIQGPEIVDMPLNGRNFTQLVLLTPGAAPVQGSQQGPRIVQEGAGAISPSVAGQRGQQNNFTMDGVINNSIYLNTWAISPPPDAIAEFNVQSHIEDAQATISSGANVNVMTRSGTDSLHGAFWEFFRNDKLDARNFFDGAKPPYRQNQYGTTISGPVMLPRFNGRKRDTWFFAYWEGFRSRKTSSYFASVPTAEERSGDFSAFLGPQIGTDTLGRPVYQGAIYDLASTRPDPSKPGSFQKDAFLNNMIPTSRLSGTAMQMLAKYYPLPNLPVGGAVFPNLLFTAPTSVNDDKMGIRIDHRFMNNDALFGRFNYTDPEQVTPAGLPTINRTISNGTRGVAIGYTHLMGPATLLSIHYGYTYTKVLDLMDPAGQSFISATHLDRYLPPANGFALAPSLSVSQDFTGVTQTAIPLGPSSNHTWNADISTVRGTHSLSAGFMYYHVHHFDDNRNASVTFARNATSLDGFTNQTGLGAASFLIGAPDGLSGWLGVTSADFSVNWYGGYLQDRWQITNKLSLSYGLRYDFVAPAHWKDNKLSAVDPDTGALLIPVAVPPLFPTPNVRQTFWDPKYNGWQPRFGVAYRATGKTVVRSGFAVFDDHNNTMIQETQAIRIAWPWGYLGNALGLNRGAPSSITYDNLPTQESFYNPLQPTSAYASNPRQKIPYAIEYNFGIQQQITPSLSAEVNYVGSVARHLELAIGWNTAVYPAAGAIGPRTPFPQYPVNMGLVANNGNSAYNGLLTKIEKRMSHGLTFLGSYTWSKSLDINSEGGAGNQVADYYNLRSSWGPSDFDLRQMFILSGSYQLPVGSQRPFLASAGKFTNAVLGGWSIGGIQSVTTGQPFSVSAGGDVANVGGGAQRAQLIGDPFSGFTQSRLEWFNTAAFKTPTVYTFGNSGKNMMRGPRQTNLDFVAYKDFAFSESKKLQFRAEFFNAPNHTRFGIPNASVQSSAFGLITSAGSPRDIQFALKFVY